MSIRETVSFRRLPHQSDLFLDYVERNPRALQFYARPPVIESLELAAREDIPTLNFPRAEMAGILLRQNAVFGSGQRTRNYIEMLRHPDSVAIVTGQQVGLLTGPLYTIYKAYSAIRIAETLQARGVRAIPVFWMDSEDHDLAEVTHCLLFEPDGSPKTVDYRATLFGGSVDDDGAHPVGSIRFSEAIHEIVSEQLGHLPESNAKEETRSLLIETYKPGASFAESFGSLMARLFQKHGLVLFDAQDEASKPLVVDVFRRAIEQAGPIHDALAARNRALQESGYHTQVHVLQNSTVLFRMEESQRRALTRTNGGFGVKNSGVDYSAADLLRQVANESHHFSPNVLLRPLVQDFLFPTIAYVAGPAETAYFAQIRALYELYSRPMPVIWPRASLTLLDPQTFQQIQRNSLAFTDCFMGKHHIVEKIIAGIDPSNATRILRSLQIELERSLEELRPALVATENSLGSALDTARRKILHQVETLQTRFVHLETRHNSRVLREAEILLNACYPNKSLQERQLSVTHFLGRYGMDWMDWIYSAVDAESFQHLLVEVE